MKFRSFANSRRKSTRHLNGRGAITDSELKASSRHRVPRTPGAFAAICSRGKGRVSPSRKVRKSAGVSAAGPKVGKGPRLCENLHERKTRSIIFSIAFPHSGRQCSYFFRLAKSREIFYTQPERRGFHTPSVESGLFGESR
jgi:hypothetical protein